MCAGWTTIASTVYQKQSNIGNDYTEGGKDPEKEIKYIEKGRPKKKEKTRKQ